VCARERDRVRASERASERKGHALTRTRGRAHTRGRGHTHDLSGRAMSTEMGVEVNNTSHAVLSILRRVEDRGSRDVWGDAGVRERGLRLGTHSQKSEPKRIHYKFAIKRTFQDLMPA
jgi:hypothetical protein